MTEGYNPQTDTFEEGLAKLRAHGGEPSPELLAMHEEFKRARNQVLYVPRNDGYLDSLARRGVHGAKMGVGWIILILMFSVVLGFAIDLLKAVS